jgi:hypothetical protein
MMRFHRSMVLFFMHECDGARPLRMRAHVRGVSNEFPAFSYMSAMCARPLRMRAHVRGVSNEFLADE